MTRDHRQPSGNRGAAIAIFEDGWNRGEFERSRRVFAPTFTFHVHGTSREMNVAELERIVAAWRQGFPDLSFELHQVIAEDAMVAIRSTLTGTHLGPWRGTTPSGNAIAVDHMFFLRFDDDLLVEVWEVLDSAALEHQVGAATGER